MEIVNTLNTIAIIGTAGRYEDGKRLTATSYSHMTDIARRFVLGVAEKEGGNNMLISGGAAWADHLAVALFLAGHAPALRLYLPCEFNLEERRFKDNGDIDWKTNPGGTCNYYHKLFSDVLGRDTLAEICDAIDTGADIVAGSGMFDRNGRIAKNSTHAIAFTFGNKEYLKDGGTAQTMGVYLKQRKTMNLQDNSYHVDLRNMQVYKGAKVA
jgi:hypothetical protein